MWSVHELIVAPATVRGSGARAVVRLSGDGLDRLLGGLFVATAGGFPRHGEAPRLVMARLASRELTTVRTSARLGTGAESVANVRNATVTPAIWTKRGMDEIP